MYKSTFTIPYHTIPLHRLAVRVTDRVADRSLRAVGVAGPAMVQLFEDYPVTESVLVWYPAVVIAAELTLPLVADADASAALRQQVVRFASTSFFVSVADYEAWHFMILYAPAAPPPPQRIQYMRRSDVVTESVVTIRKCVTCATKGR